VQESQRKGKLIETLKRFSKLGTIVFVTHKADVDSISGYLQQYGYKVGSLHGGKAQEKREYTMEAFRDGKIDILVATNVAARGLDVEGVDHVVNFNCPANITDYVHRIGRTGRAGNKGMATTFLSPDDAHIFNDLKKFLQDNGQYVPHELLQHKGTGGGKK